MFKLLCEHKINGLNRKKLYQDYDDQNQLDLHVLNGKLYTNKCYLL